MHNPELTQFGKGEGKEAQERGVRYTDCSPSLQASPTSLTAPLGSTRHSTLGLKGSPLQLGGSSLIPTQPPLSTHTNKTAIQYSTPRIAQKTTVPFYFPMNFTIKLLTALQPSPHKFAVHSQFCPFHGHFLPLDPSHTPWDLTWPLHRWLLRFPTLHAT